jgi:ligand-binding sensor protein
MAKPPAIIMPPTYNIIIAILCDFTSPLLIANQAVGTVYIVRILRRCSGPK